VDRAVSGTKRPRRAWIIARTDLRQLRRSRDFWMPLLVVASLFFVILPTFLFLSITSIQNQEFAQQLGDVVDVLPSRVQEQVRGESPEDQIAYALAVFLFAPLAIVVPLTVSSAIGSHTIVGERERGSGEFLAHSPASEREIFLGKMMAALLPGYATAALGFTLYSLVVNVIVGSKIGGWFFPTASWWVMMLWIVPPFLALVVALILNISARVTSAAAAQQASALVSLPLIVVAYGFSTQSLASARTWGGLMGLVAWLAAGLAMWRGARSVRRERLLGLGG
jgi:ABC-type Na+ efflux pump permease subunit